MGDHGAPFKILPQPMVPQPILEIFSPGHGAPNGVHGGPLGDSLYKIHKSYTTYNLRFRLFFYASDY